MSSLPFPDRFQIANVEVWNPDGVQTAQDVFFENGELTHIESAGRRSAADEVYEARGHVLLPAGLDLQVHLRTPGQNEKETPDTGLRAALRGGIGGVLTMPNTKPIIDSVETVELARKLCAEAEARTGVEVFISAAMTIGQIGEKAVDAQSLKEAGVVALTDDGRGVASDAVMDEVFSQAALSGLPVLQHAEMPGHGGVLAPGATQKKLGIPAYAPEAEWRMVERDIQFLRHHPKARYHVLHVSSRTTLDLIRQARADGLLITGEVTAHHLYFTSDDIPEGVTSFKMNPPIRSAVDRDALVAALADGTLSWTATDHAPHDVKSKGTNFLASAFGTTGLETSLRVLFGLWQNKKLTAERLVEVFSTAPARYIGSDDKFGNICVGDRLRAVGGGYVLADPKAPPRAVEERELESLSKNNCFIGAPLAGRVLAVLNGRGWHRFEA